RRPRRNRSPRSRPDRTRPAPAKGHLMTILGISDSTVASVVRPVTDSRHDRDAVATRFARGVWSSIAEPGDRIAHHAIAALGAETALAHLIDDRDGKLLRHALADRVGAGAAGGTAGEDRDDARALALNEGVDDGELADAVTRWAPRLSKTDALR